MQFDFATRSKSQLAYLKWYVTHTLGSCPCLPSKASKHNEHDYENENQPMYKPYPHPHDPEVMYNSQQQPQQYPTANTPGQSHMSHKEWRKMRYSNGKAPRPSGGSRPSGGNNTTSSTMSLPNPALVTSPNLPNMGDVHYMSNPNSPQGSQYQHQQQHGGSHINPVFQNHPYSPHQYPAASYQQQPSYVYGPPVPYAVSPQHHGMTHQQPPKHHQSHQPQLQQQMPGAEQVAKMRNSLLRKFRRTKSSVAVTKSGEQVTKSNVEVGHAQHQKEVSFSRTSMPVMINETML